MDRQQIIENPYRPGAGHLPPVLGGRKQELDYFRRTLRQRLVIENVLVTGLRGFGKTVLVEHLKLIAQEQFWVWAGADLSESSSLSEERLALRILTDVAAALVRTISGEQAQTAAVHESLRVEGGGPLSQIDVFDALKSVYEREPGLPNDKLKAALGLTISIIAKAKMSGLVLMYDEAQCLSDHAQTNEFPMSMLIETVAALQKHDGIAPCMLVLSGLPGVYDALTATRTYTERMFRVLHLDRLDRAETASAVIEPLIKLSPPLHPSRGLVEKAIDLSGGYPYLIQFFGKELVDQLLRNGGVLTEDEFPSSDIIDRLDAGLFGARWNRTSDKQRAFLRVLATRPLDGPFDFSAKEIAHISPYTNGQASQMLQALAERGLVYRSRHGRYAFTVPMSESMILGRLQSQSDIEESWLSGATSGEDVVVEETGAKKRRRWSWFG